MSSFISTSGPIGFLLSNPEDKDIIESILSLTTFVNLIYIVKLFINVIIFQSGLLKMGLWRFNTMKFLSTSLQILILYQSKILVILLSVTLHYLFVKQGIFGESKLRNKKTDWSIMDRLCLSLYFVRSTKLSQIITDYISISTHIE